MLQVQVLTGKQADQEFTVRRYPFTIGRNPTDTLRLQDAGVWGRHLKLRIADDDRIVIKVRPETTATAQHQSFDEKTLVNGDTVEFGAVKLKFWFSPTVQYRQQVREWLSWIGVAALVLVQLGLVYWLIR